MLLWSSQKYGTGSIHQKFPLNYRIVDVILLLLTSFMCVLSSDPSVVKNVCLPALVTEASVFASSESDLPQSIMGCPVYTQHYYFKLQLHDDTGSLIAAMFGEHAVSHNTCYILDRESHRTPPPQAYFKPYIIWKFIVCRIDCEVSASRKVEILPHLWRHNG